MSKFTEITLEHVTILRCRPDGKRVNVFLFSDKWPTKEIAVRQSGKGDEAELGHIGFERRQSFPCENFLQPFLVTAVDQMVLGQESCPTKVHCTAVFALEDGRFSCLGGESPHNTPLSFVSEEDEVITFCHRCLLMNEEL